LLLHLSFLVTEKRGRQLETQLDCIHKLRSMLQKSFSYLRYFFLCTFAATFRRSALSRMKPVASSWL